MLDFVLDENIQIHGGNGFVQRLSGRTPLPRRAREPDLRGHQRDQPAADSGHAGATRASRATCRSSRPPRRCRTSCSGRRRCRPPTTRPLAEERRAVDAFKKTGADGVRRRDADVRRRSWPTQQEVLMHVADILIDVFSAESAVLRARRAADADARRAPLHADAARVFVNDAAMRIDASARQALAAMAEGDTLRTMLAALRRLLKFVADRHRRAAAAAGRRGGRPRRLHLCVTDCVRGRVVAGRRRCRLRPASRRTTRGTTPAKVAARPRREGRGVPGRQRPDSEGAARPVPAARVLPDRSGLQRAGRRSSRATIRRSSRCRRRPARTGRCGAPAAGVHAEGTAAEADGVPRGRRPTRATCSCRSAISRAAPRRTPPAASGPRSQRHGHLRGRLQPRVSSRTATTTRPTSVRIRRAENRLKIPIRAGERMKK